MYCQKCGYKLSKGSYICSNCGSQNQDIEYCGGFWGLTGEKKEYIKECSGREIEELAQKPKSKLKKSKNSYFSARFICLIFFVIILGIAAKYFYQAKKMDELTATVEILQKQADQTKVLKKKNKTLKKENDKLKDKIQEFEKSNITNEQTLEQEKGFSGENNYTDTMTENIQDNLY